MEEGFDQDHLTRRIMLRPDGQLIADASVAVDPEQVPFAKLQEGEVFIFVDERQVFQIRDGLVRKLEFVLEPKLEPLSRYLCEDGGYGSDTGRPIC